tara:strand:- start:1691 stop:2092 length:402 start_codon:yes stop_codon:yes gene_type:complete
MSKLEGISVKLPLSYSQEDGPYKLNKTLGDVIKQNFKNLILTIPGERVMMPDFGVGLYRMLFEPMNSVTYQDISATIYKQTSKYMPFVSIETLRFDTNDQDSSLDMNQVKVIIQYNIGSINARDVLQITATST